MTSQSDDPWGQRELDSPPPRCAIWPWLALAAIVGLVLVYWANRPQGRDATSHPAVGKRLARFELQPLTAGNPMNASDLTGKVTLINFWGPWCPPCRIEFPHLKELEQHFRKREDFLFVSVSCSGGPGEDLDMEESTAEFLAQQQADFPTYRDAFETTRIGLAKTAKLPGFAYPTTVILDREQTIRGFWQGYTPGDELQMRQVVENALSAAVKSR